MAFTQSDLNAINTAIASGVLEVEFENERTKYNSIGELIKAKKAIQAELDSVGGVRRPLAVVSRYKRNL